MSRSAELSVTGSVAMRGVVGRSAPGLTLGSGERFSFSVAAAELGQKQVNQ